MAVFLYTSVTTDLNVGQYASQDTKKTRAPNPKKIKTASKTVPTIDEQKQFWKLEEGQNGLPVSNSFAQFVVLFKLLLDADWFDTLWWIQFLTLKRAH